MAATSPADKVSKLPLTLLDDAEPDLDALMVQVARGDTEAFRILFDNLGRSVYGRARQVLRSPSRAEEVAQDVFMQVWRTATRYELDKGHAKSWVLMITHRRAVDAVRHDQAAKLRDNSYGQLGTTDHNVVEEAVELRADQFEVHKCLNTLTTLQRESISMAYYDGHTYSEVADILGANAATIKTRMRDGIIRLRDCMEAA